MSVQPVHADDFPARLVRLAADGGIADLESLWIDRLADLPVQAAFYQEFLKAARRGRIAERVESLIALLAEERLAAGEARFVRRLLRAAVPVYPKSEALRSLLIQTLQVCHADIENVRELLALAGLAGTAPLPEAFQAFQGWIRLTPGQVYQHTDWGEGIIRQLDAAAGKILIDFPGQAGRVMTPDGVRKYLKYLDPAHFLARRAKHPETLYQIAESNPVELVKMVLASQDGQEVRQGDLKNLLTPAILPAEDWNGWWSRTREALKLDPYIDFDAAGGARALLRLRAEPRSFPQEIEEAFFAADASNSLRAELIRQIARRPKDSGLSPELVRRLAAALHDQWGLSAAAGPAARLEIAYMLDDLAAAMPEAGVATLDITPLMAAIGDYEALFEIDNVDYGIRALEQLLTRDGEEGCRRAAQLLPRAPVKLAQAIWRALNEEKLGGREAHHEHAVAALRRLFANPLANVETYTWAMRAVLSGSWEHLEEEFPAAAMVPDILDDMETWQRLAADGPKEQAAAARSLLSRMRTLLAADKYEALCKAVEPMTREAVGRLRHRIQVHGALASSFKLQADRALALTRRDLEEAPSPAEREADIHYCTPRSVAEKANELRDISAVKIPQNSRIIEAARMEGDLRENAGYQYAKEEQKMLMQQQASLADLLSRAHVVTAAQVDVATVGFGTEVRLRNLKDGQEERYIILGRWEADPERHVLSMQAPLARQLMGHAVGQTLTIEHPGGGATDYTILEITNAMASGAWDRPPQSPGTATP